MYNPSIGGFVKGNNPVKKVDSSGLFEEYAHQEVELSDRTFPYNEQPMQTIRESYIRAALYGTRIKNIEPTKSEDKPEEEKPLNNNKEYLEEKIAWATLEKLLKIGEKGSKDKRIVLYQLDDLKYIADFLENINNQLDPSDNIKFEYHESEKGNHIHTEIYGTKVEIQSKKRFENTTKGQTISDVLEILMNYIILHI